MKPLRWNKYMIKPSNTINRTTRRFSAERGFSLMENLIGGALILTSGYAYYNVTVAHQQGLASIAISSDLRSSLRGTLEQVSNRGQYQFFPLPEKGDAIGLYYLCSRFDRKTYLTHQQEREGKKAEHQTTIKRSKNAHNELGYATVSVKKTKPLTHDSCRRLGSSISKVADLFKLEHLADAKINHLSDCLAAEKVGLKIDDNHETESCPNSNVITFLYPFQKTPHVLSWTFKLNKARTKEGNGRFIKIEKGLIDWALMARN